MAKTRKDPRGRVLRTGESYREAKDIYQFAYTNVYGKRSYIYAKDLYSLRDKEAKLRSEVYLGIDTYLAGMATLDFVFERYMKVKSTLRGTTLANYRYTYEHFARNYIGKRKIKDFRYTDIYNFYVYLAVEKNLALKTIEGVHTLLCAIFILSSR